LPATHSLLLNVVTLCVRACVRLLCCCCSM
jgi:hypothetical protein